MTTPQAIGFESIDTAPRLDGGEIHVWHIAADPGDGSVAKTAHAALARFLCFYAGLVRAPTIERAQHGKPFSPELPDLDFNLSHAGAHVLLAFARAQALGIDLEHGERQVSLPEIAHRFFAPAEAQALDRMSPARRQSAFLELWTRKEAVLKALGAGLQFGLARVEFTVEQDGAVGALAHIAPEGGCTADWRVLALRPAAGLIGALAWRGPQRSVRAFRLAP
ncbi:MAG: 4'-phosphopantetheinyl transferase superfamily protein [Dokdonella sp.]